MSKTLFNVSPSVAIHNFRDRLLVYAASVCKSLLRYSSGIQLTDLNDVFCFEFALRKLLSFGISSLTHRICNVISARSKEQMVRIYACPNVASVQNEESIWNFSKVNNPGYSVCCFPFVVYPGKSVSILTDISFPNPAATLFSYLVKKSSRVRKSTLATKVSIVVRNLGLWSVDFFAASVTVYLHLKTFLSDVNGAIGDCRWLCFNFTTKTSGNPV